MVEQLIKFLEANTEIELVNFNEFDGEYYKFFGLDPEDYEVEIKVSTTNRIWIEEIEQGIYIPFNVWE